jgi:hypothetical protein
VSIVTVFFVAAALIAALVGTSLLFPGTVLDRMWTLNEPAYVAFRLLGKVSGVALMAVGILSAATAAGLLQRSRWAWQLGLGIFAFNGLGDVVGFGMTRDLLKSGSGVLIAALFLIALSRRKVRIYFAPHENVRELDSDMQNS